MLPMPYPHLHSVAENLQVRTAVTLYQIVTPMAFNLGVEFPDNYEQIVSSFEVRPCQK